MLDGELVSFDVDGRTSSERLGERMLMRRRDVPVSFVAFDLLAIDGTATMAQPYEERRVILETRLRGTVLGHVPRFDDGVPSQPLRQFRVCAGAA